VAEIGIKKALKNKECPDSPKRPDKNAQIALGKFLVATVATSTMGRREYVSFSIYLYI